MKSSLILVFSFTAIVSHATHANSFLNKHAEGWFWYETKVKEEIEKREEIEKIEKQRNFITPTEIIESNKKELEKKLHKAILVPSFLNVKEYMNMQKQMIARGEAFANKWQEVVYREPSLNEEVSYPTSHSILPIHYEQIKLDKETKIKEIAENFGLLYFFKSDCPYCIKFSPIAKRFAEKFGFEIVGVSIDGGNSQEFLDFVSDNGASKKLGITRFPTLLAVNENTKEIIPITYGYVSMNDLEETLYFLSKAKDEKAK